MNGRMAMRTKIGLIALVLALLALAAWLRGSDPILLAAYVRTAIVMGVLWMAWPELTLLPRWIYISLPILLILGAFRPQILFFAVPGLLLYWFLVPKPKKGDRGENGRGSPKK